jgi:hypothetical protein
MVTVENSRGIKAIKFVSIRIGKTIENIIPHTNHIFD